MCPIVHISVLLLKNQFIILLKDGPVEPCLTSERLMVQVKLKTLIPFAVVSGRASVEKPLGRPLVTRDEVQVACIYLCFKGSGFRFPEEVG